jgi:hypothetical protein
LASFYFFGAAGAAFATFAGGCDFGLKNAAAVQVATTLSPAA